MIKQGFKINGRNEIPFVGSVRERERGDTAGVKAAGLHYRNAHL